jgi:hypothetical protein
MDLDEEKPRRGKHKFGSVPGYVATFKDKKWFYLTSDQLAKIIGSIKTARQLKNELVQAGMMASTGNGKFSVQRPIFSGAKGNKGYERVHAFRLKLLQDQNRR